MSYVLRNLLGDLRYGARTLGKSRGFTMIVILIFAVSIGANTAIFSVIDAVFLRTMPYYEPSGLVEVSEGAATRSVPAGDFLDWENQAQSVQDLSATDVLQQYTFTGAAAPDQLWGTAVSANFFRLLGVRTLLGRTFLPGEMQSAVLSNHCWRTHFSNDPNILGRSFMLGDKQFTVIGVMPPEFYFGTDVTDLWIPLALTPKDTSNHAEGSLSVFGRLRKGTTRAHAEAEIQTIQSRVAKGFGKVGQARRATVSSLNGPTLGDFRLAIQSLAGAVVFTLLIGCANVANMYLVRAAERQREMSIRSALGAGRLRMVQQLLTESCIVSILGGGAGLLLAVGGLRSILAAVPGSAVSSLGTLNRASINLPVLGFTFVLSLITGVVVGALPAWKASRLDLVQSLKEGARGTGVSVRRIETQSVLVVVEIALSLILLVGAGLMVESFHRLATVPLGFDPDHVLTLQLPASSYDFRKVTEPSIFYKTVLDRIGAIPSVEAVGMTNDSPLSPLATHLAVALSGVSWAGSSTPVHVDFQDVSSGYFLAMGMRLLQGRYFTADDNNGGPPVAIINNAMANRYWSKENPVGQSLYGNVTIVGVIGDTVQGSLAKKAEPMIYRPFDQQPITAAAIDFVIRTEGDPLRIVPAVRTAVWDISPSQAIVQVRTMNDAIADSVWRPRFTATMLAILALVDLFLTAAGLYGVISHIISKRSREIGIRMALGAQRRDVACMVIGDSLKLSVIGIALGLVGSLATTRLLAGILFSIRPEDPATLIGAILVLTAAAMGASCIPVRRATRVDPVVALRYE